MKAVSFLMGIILCSCVAVPLVGAASYTITDLGVPDGPYVASYAESISNSGVVVGWAENTSGEHHAFVWENDTMTSLGTLGGDESEALHINNLEQVVGWADNADGNVHAFFWEGDTMTDLGTMGGPISRAFGISISGQVAGYSNTAGSADYHACLWDGDTVSDLGTLGGPWSKAYGINDNGQVVGKSDSGETIIDPQGTERNIVPACMWQGDTVIDLGTLGGVFGQANHVNNMSQVVGSSYLAIGNNAHAFIWESGIMTDLGTLGGVSSEAHGINEFGQVVGFSDGNAFIWENGAMTDLNDSIPLGSGWTLVEAYDINNADQIVGWGINPSGQEHAFLLTPTEYDVYPGDSIQTAIDAAGEGDTIVVAPAIYYENINFKGKNIVLTSIDPYDKGVIEKTIIDGSRPDNPDSGSVVTFDGSETSTCVLSGFTIQNGTGYRGRAGGGIHGRGTHATIEYNIITNNYVGDQGASRYGGGIHDCDGLIRYNTISGNIASGTSAHGGGLNACDGIIRHNVIDNNSTTYGGGLSSCNGVIEKNIISNNITEGVGDGGGLAECHGIIKDNFIYSNRGGNGIKATHGGGLHDCDGQITNNVIYGNRTGASGGGLAFCDGLISSNIIISNEAIHGGGLGDCSGFIELNIISRNYASTVGGGLSDCYSTIQDNVVIGNYAFQYGGGLYDCEGTIQNNFISFNLADRSSGGGLGNCDALIMNNTLIENSADDFGGGLYNCTGEITNTIIWGNSADTGPQLYQYDTPTYSCIQDWIGGGEGNINFEPQFVGNPYDTGTWSNEIIFDTATYQSVLTDTTASWGMNELAGMFINPDTSVIFQCYIVSNTDSAITVWGDLSSDTLIGKTYVIYNYHLQESSPCIDSGYMFANSGEYDLDGNPRYVDASDSTGWDGTIKGMVYDSGDTLHIAWKLIDMGAYEYQPSGDLYDTFTLQIRDDLDSGSWQDAYTGKASSWTDTQPIGVKQRFYRVWGE